MNRFANLKNKNEWNPLVEGCVGGGGCQWWGGAGHIIKVKREINISWHCKSDDTWEEGGEQSRNKDSSRSKFAEREPTPGRRCIPHCPAHRQHLTFGQITLDLYQGQPFLSSESESEDRHLIFISYVKGWMDPAVVVQHLTVHTRGSLQGGN